MIICFSGTGNSSYVARQLASHTGDSVILLDSETLLRPESKTIDLNGEKHVVWVFPTHSWGVPPMILNVISHITLHSDKPVPHYMVTTCGDDIGYCDMMWKKSILKRGWQPKGAYTVIMPNTYIALPGFDTDSPEIEKSKIEAASPRIKKIADAIINGVSETDVVRGVVPFIKTRIIYPLFMKFLTAPKRFKVNRKTCTGCGKCARECPVRNIKMENHVPVWGDRCAACLRCLHTCPTASINYSRYTVGKHRYTKFLK